MLGITRIGSRSCSRATISKGSQSLLSCIWRHSLQTPTSSIRIAPITTISKPKTSPRPVIPPILPSTPASISHNHQLHSPKIINNTNIYNRFFARILARSTATTSSSSSTNNTTQMSADELADHTKTVSVQPYPVTKTRRELYPEIEPFATGRLKVSDLHEIYFEQSGNPNGKPVVFVHGGPGGGTEAKHRRFFNPEKYHIILFDQRGCGKSKPFSCLEQNTTWDLVADMEKIREHLQIDRWMVFGGSWGSTLALAYAETHPERVTQLVLRGIFLLRKKEINWFYQEGASYIYPDAWEHYLKPIPVEERGDLLRAYHKRLTSSDPQVRKEAATAWSVWEGTTSKLYTEPAFASEYAEEEFADAFARIECHYFINEGFFSTEGKGQLIENVHKIRHIPTVIVQGRYDVVCPIVSAWELHKEFPEAKLEIISDAGHSQFEPGITDRLVRACDAFADQ